PFPASFSKSTLAEQFPNLSDFEKHWKVSKSKKDAGGKVVTENEALFNYNGKWALEEPSVVIGTPEGDLGLVMKNKAAHFAISRTLDTPLTFKDSDLVVIQYELKLQDGLECGGAYMKLLSASKSFNPELFTDLSPYTIMFGPDKCGATNKVHFIFRHQNKKTKEIIEHHLKHPPTVPITSSKQTHLYTLLIEPSKNHYDIWIDGTSVKSGSLLEDFEPPVVPPKEIPDKNAKKPEDWVDQEKIPDPDAKKPEDWDETAPLEIEDMDAKMPEDWLENEPANIPDPKAEKPSSWDDSEDGEWEPNVIPNPKCSQVSGCGPWKRPMKRNPNYKGPWTPSMIPNPAFKGKWKPAMVPNPMYIEDTTPGYMTPIGAVGFELWTMQDGFFFDNILIGNQITKEELKQWNEGTFKVKSDIEKAIEKMTDPSSSSNSLLNSDKDAMTPLPLSEQFQWQNVKAFFELALIHPVHAWQSYPVLSMVLLSGSVLSFIILLFSLTGSKKSQPTSSSSAKTSSASSSAKSKSSKSTTSGTASGVKTNETEGVKLRSSSKKVEDEKVNDSDEKENQNEDSE
ncbi:hypothetical protein HMI56_006443, partial [Coelomomyces lativittatus]